MQSNESPISPPGPVFRAAQYVRMSTEHQQYSTENQADKIREYAARRNIEMLAGLVLRDVLRFPLRIVFTSASQRHHSAWSRFLIARMDALISTSTATAGYLKHPSTVIGHGIDTKLFHPADDRAAARAALGLPDLRLVGCFGRIRRQKGTDVFVDAMLRILPDRPDAGAVVLMRVCS